MPKQNKQGGEKITYLEFIDKGGKVFPDDLYFKKKTTFGKIKYN